MQGRTNVWSADVEKWHAGVVRSAFVSQNVQNTACSDHFFEVQKNGTPLWCQAHV